MQYGHYSDDEIPKQHNPGYAVNSSGYRCAEWRPMPDGKKNVVVLGCSHTFGEGLDEGEVWVDRLSSKTDARVLRWWNLGQPGASGEKIVRILYGTEKVLFPKIIIICWPLWSRRERLLDYNKRSLHQINLVGGDTLLKYENSETDQQNFLKNIFFAEKFAEKQNATLFHCFAHDMYEIPNTSCFVFTDYTIKTCWPQWDSKTQRQIFIEPNFAKDGRHFGVEHHRVFAEKFYNRFKSKLK